MRARWLAVAVLIPFALGACGLVLGLEDHERFPAGVDAAAADAAADAPTVGDDRDPDIALAEASDDSVVPIGDHRVVSVAAGGAYACVLVDDGTVWCWGGDLHESLGSDPAGEGICTQHPCRTAPTQVAGLSDITQIGAGVLMACALRKDGAVLCWGDDGSGALGHIGIDDTCADGTPCNWRATQVTALPAVAQIAVGDPHACARTTKGAVFCWGDNTYGELGSGKIGTRSAKPVPVTGMGGGVIDISASAYGYHTCAVKTDGTVWCWGQNTRGALGHDKALDDACAVPGQAGVTVACNVTPTQVKVDKDHPLSGVSAVQAGYLATCAMTQASAVLCWGYNGLGQLGRGNWDANVNIVPEPLTVVDSIASLTMHSTVACAIDSAKSLWCWGDNSWGALGGGTAGGGPCESGQACKVAATKIASIAHVVQAAAGMQQVIAVGEDGAVWSWGANLDGRLAHAPGAAGDVQLCPVGSDAGLACNPSPTRVAGLP
jgi:alpha-tubulin suppressor-like RCC1 family protein